MSNPLTKLFVALGLDSSDFESDAQRVKSKASALGAAISTALSGATLGAGIGAGMAALQVGMNLVSGAVSGLKNATLGLGTGLENTRAQIFSFTKDMGLTGQILAMVRKEADKTPFGFLDLGGAIGGLIPVARRANEPLMEVLKTAEILAASNPAEGIQGGMFALKEAVLSNDFTSVIERFNLSRDTINRLREQGVPALEAVRQAMAELGLDGDLIANMADTMTGRWSTFMDTLDSIKLKLTTPLFEVLKQGLVEVQAFFDANAETIGAWATLIGQWIGRGAQVVLAGLRTIAGGALEMARNWIGNLAGMESETARSLGRIAGFMSGLAQVAVGWGSGIVNALATGIQMAVGAVISAIQFLGRVIGGWLEPHSPPKVLPELDTWGEATAQTWVDSWGNADLSTIRQLAARVGAQIQNLQGELGAIRDRQADISDARRMKDLKGQLKEGNLTAEQREEIQLQIKEIALAQKLRKLQREASRLGELEKEKSALEKIGDAIGGIGKALKEAVNPLVQQLRATQLQQDEMRDLIRLQELQAILNDKDATAAEKKLAALEMQAIATQRQLRAQEAAELGIDLSSLSEVPIVLEDIGLGADAAAGKVGGLGGKLAGAAGAIGGPMADLSSIIGDAAGEMEEAFDPSKLGLGAFEEDLQRIKDQFNEGFGEGELGFENFSTRMNEKLAGLKEKLQPITDFLAGITANQDVVNILFAIAASVGMLWVADLVVGGIAVLAAGVATLGGAMAAAMPFIIGTAAAIGAPMFAVIGLGIAVGVLYYLWQINFGGMKDFTDRFGENVGLVFAAVEKAVKVTLPQAIHIFQVGWSRSWGAVRDDLNEVWVGKIKPILESIAKFIDDILRAFGKMGQAASEAAGAVTGGLVGGGANKEGEPVAKHNAAGTKSFAGGFTTLDEQGKELVFLPRGTEIVNHNQSRALMAGLAGSNQTINYHITNNTKVDVEEMYWRLGELHQQRAGD